MGLEILASALLASPLVLGAMVWYGHNAHRAITKASRSADDPRFGTKAPFGHKFPIWLHRLDQVTFLQYVDVAMLVILGTALVLLIRRRRHHLQGGLRAMAPYAACVLTPLVVLALFATSTNDEIRYLLPVIPFLALLIAGLISSVNSRIIGVAALGVLAVQFVLVNLPTTSFNSTKYRYIKLGPPQRNARPRDDLALVARLSCPPGAGGKISIAGVHYPWANMHNIEMLAYEAYAGSGRRCHYVSLDITTTGQTVSPARASQVVRGVDPPFYIALDYGNPRNPVPRGLRLLSEDTGPPFNSTSAIVFRSLLTSGQWRVVPGSRIGGFIVLQHAPKKKASHRKASHRRQAKA